VDYVVMMLASLLSFLLLLAFSVGIVDGEFFVATLLVFVAFWLPFIWMNYAFSFFLKDAENSLSMLHFSLFFLSFYLLSSFLSFFLSLFRIHYSYELFERFTTICIVTLYVAGRQ
jgi:hypothetical protein